MYVHEEGTRLQWTNEQQRYLWQRLGDGTLRAAWFQAFGGYPGFVNDDSASTTNPKKPNIFRVDYHGNVVASKKGEGGELIETDLEVVHHAPCAIEIDHLLPWSRGGESDGSNLESICWLANQRKNSKLLHGPLYLNGWKECDSKGEGLNNGISVDQFISLWKYVQECVSNSSRTKRGENLEDTAMGKKLLGYLLKPNTIFSSQTTLSKILSQKHIQGKELYFYLKFVANEENAFTAENLDETQRFVSSLKANLFD
jgi:hypothetical protein